MTEELTLYIKEAVDRSSIQNLESLLLKLNGVERALVDTQDGEVKITYDTNRISSTDVEETIRQNGFYLS
ncbi:heavy-metal-associated domain-containing protein [Bacillus salacetis]|uniref:Heavy-metal-associated domain-containing protein n=1 Tax=Bacillus salacetis TaxID=2315464 RepID=A0A3A1QZ27_9BACI|nr:heavy metal-associated domain-containing protein [Bacillus salacetis]RIW32272.1 heavy-metal-associated domain-containing protein [Bacillus salacetis]